MKFSEETNANQNNITRYGEGFIEIKGKKIDTSVIISRETFITSWQPQSFGELSPEHCLLLVENKPDVILLGTGKTQQFPEHEILKLFAQHQIGIEVMDTSAACRTFNILLSEDRNVVAGLFMI